MTKGNLAALEAALAALGDNENTIREDEFTTKDFAARLGITRGAAQWRLVNAVAAGQLSVRQARIDGKRQSVYSLVLPTDVKKPKKQNRGSTKGQSKG